MGGWVEEEDAVGMRCCGLCMGGWVEERERVDGWVGGLPFDGGANDDGDQGEDERGDEGDVVVGVVHLPQAEVA